MGRSKLKWHPEMLSAKLAIAALIVAAATVNAIPVAQVERDKGGPLVYAIDSQCRGLFCKNRDLAVVSFPADGARVDKTENATIIPFEKASLEEGTDYTAATIDEANSLHYGVFKNLNGTAVQIVQSNLATGATKDIPVDPSLQNLVALNYVADSKQLIATTFDAVYEVDVNSGNVSKVLELTGYINGGHTTTDGKSLYVDLHKDAQWYIATIDLQAQSMKLSDPDFLPAGDVGHLLVGLHWHTPYQKLVGMRTAAGMLGGMQVGNFSADDAAALEMVKESFGLPHYTDYKAPKKNVRSFVAGDSWFAAMVNTGDSNNSEYQLTSIPMKSKNPKVDAYMLRETTDCFVSSQEP